MKVGWEHRPMGFYQKRYAYTPTDDEDCLRILWHNRDERWIVRWEDEIEDDDHYLPGDLTVEEAQAAALVIWRMSR
jgi:hypothetical protein